MKKYTSRSPGVIIRSAFCLFLLTLFFPLSSHAQPMLYQDSLDLVGIMQNNCINCPLEDVNSGYYWDTLQPVQNWPGVTVSNGRITQLTLTHRNLTGQLASLSNCDQLNLLDVGFNQLTGISDLNSQVNLAMLFCQENYISVLPDLDQNTQLIFLDCSENQLLTLPELNQCASLQTLNCQANQLAQLPNLDSLSWLVRISCDHNQLSQLPNLSHCPLLQELNCHHNHLESIPGLEDCTGLLYLNCHNNRLTSLPSLDSLNLQVLNCRENNLTFFHLEPIVGGPVVFEYAPQDTVVIHQGDSILRLETDGFEMQIQQGGGDSTAWQWQLDNIDVSGPQSRVLPYNGSGWYTCTMTNSKLPLLTLFTRPVHAYYDKGVYQHDATGEVRADMFDLAVVALNYGETGVPRLATYRTTPSTCDTVLVPAYDWTDLQNNPRTYTYGPDVYNLKHVDCNGDGQIDASDMGCVGNFYKATQLPMHLQGTEQDSIVATPVALAGQVKALDSHRVEIPYEIRLGALPQGMTSVKVKGIVFSRPLVNSVHYSLNQIGVDFGYSDWIPNAADAMWLDKNQGLDPGDFDPGTCSFGVMTPRDVGIFLKDSARILQAGDILVGDIVTIEDVFKFDNPNNIGLDSFAVKMRTLQAVLYIEDGNGDVIPLVVDCSTDSVMIYPDDLFAELYPGEPDTNSTPNLPGFYRYHRAIVDTSSQADPAQKNGALYQNGPNPFSDYTVIWFDVPFDMHVNFEIMDPTGKVIKRFEGYYLAGRHTIQWDGRNEGGSRIMTGTYVIRMIAGEHQHVRKMVVLSQGP